jgi:ribonucleoside-diphosphate reductase alpha chain
MEPTTAAETSAATLIDRYFTRPGIDPLDEVEWVQRDAWPNQPRYHVADIEVPDFWTQEALDITSKLYLAKGDYTETSVRALIERVASKITFEGARDGYFGDVVEPNSGWDSVLLQGRRAWLRRGLPEHPAQIFYAELCYVLVHQLATFNSPVWFNVGRDDRPQQVSACFLLGVKDDTGSIMTNATREAHIFKLGSGSGYSTSPLRGMDEPLSTGGTASGPTSFMRLNDAVAGTFKSGDMTRRAAKLVRLDADHPDIEDFIDTKVREEKRLRILADAGVNVTMDEEGERNVAECTAYQNANNSVGVTDQFMKIATDIVAGRKWDLLARVDGRVMKSVDAAELLDKIAQAAWFCADPGMQYDTTINDWHTTPAQGRIESSNPCGEYFSNPDTSCNLGSMNVLRFVNDDTSFDTESYQRAVDVMATAMDILISFADFPDDEVRGGNGLIGERTRALRQLGLGYSNMGAAIMAQGMPYDSDQARDFAAAVTALNTGRIYRQSAIVAERMGPFEHFRENSETMLGVIDKHMEHLRGHDPHIPIEDRSNLQIWHAAHEAWHSARDRGECHGYRNAQASVLPPAGTTSYQLGCDTTGLEPAFELVSYKDLAGGGSMKLVNKSVKRGLEALGYDPLDVDKIVHHVEHTGYLPTTMSIDGTPVMNPEHVPVFHGAGEISPEGHIKMVAAVQPFVSGGITKTINLREETTWEEIRGAYVLAWELGCKGLSVYRDQSKVRQVLASSPKIADPAPFKPVDEIVEGLDKSKSVDLEIERQIDPRLRLPRTAPSVRHKIHIRSGLGIEHEGYLHAGWYPDSDPPRLGEIFVDGFGKHGGFTQNALGAWATDFSIALQYGVPMEVLCKKHAFVSDETGGVVVPPSDKSEGMVPLRTCHSIVDYIARWLVAQFGSPSLQEELGVMKIAADTPEPHVIGGEYAEPRLNGHSSAIIPGPPCPQCGEVMRRVGACLQCGCGYNTGCG